MKIVKLKIINSIKNNMAPSTQLFKTYLQNIKITYLILPLLNLLANIQIEEKSVNILYNLITEIYINYKEALTKLGYSEEVPDNVLILYLVFLSKNYNFQKNEINFLLEKYNQIKGYIPNTQYSRYIFYQVKIYILQLYTLDIIKYKEFIVPLIEDIDALYENLDKPFIF